MTILEFREKEVGERERINCEPSGWKVEGSQGCKEYIVTFVLSFLPVRRRYEVDVDTLSLENLKGVERGRKRRRKITR